MPLNNKVYIVDNWHRRGPNVDGPTRRWQEMVGDHDPIHRLDSSCQLMGGIVIIHWTFFRGGFLDRHAAHKALVELAQSRPQISFLVISGGGADGSKPASNLYFRKAPVHEPEDKQFSVLFAQFKKTVQLGNPDFDLLDHAAFPDELMAVYLIALASPTKGEAANRSPNDTDRKWTEKFAQGLLGVEAWARAQEQFRERIAVGDSNGQPHAHFAIGNWPASVFEGGMPRDGFLDAVRSVLREG